MLNPNPKPEMVTFLERRINPIFNSLLKGKYRLGLIQKAFLENDKLIRGKYPVPGKFINSDKTSLELFNQDIQMPLRCRVEKGQPTILVLVGDWLAIFNKLKASIPPKAESVFESMLAIALNHEFDHFALGTIPQDDHIDTPTEAFESERTTWPRTCERTLKPFIEIYKKQLSDNDMGYHNAWMACGRNAESEEWRSFIAEAYGIEL